MPFLTLQTIFSPCHMTASCKKRYRIFLFLLLFAVCIIFLTVWSKSAEADAHYNPSYEKESLSPIMTKEVLSQADYATLYTQTGLGRAAIDTLRSTHKEALVFQIQDAFFADATYSCTPNSIVSREEHITDNAGRPVRACSIPVIEDGDILLTSSSHTFGWRNGHAAIVADADSRTTLESVVLGQNSSLQSVDKWETYANFRILRLKGVSKEKRAEIASDAVSRLTDIPYGLLSVHKNGVSSDKTPSTTHCAHLVWYAYACAGYDLDSDGGYIVTPDDIADSPLLEIIQVYGIKP